MNTGIKVGFVIVAAAVFAALMTFAAIGYERTSNSTAGAMSVAERQAALAPSDRVGALSIPAFSLVDQDGTAVTNDVFKGKVTILDFFYTHCPLICPMMSTKMSDLSDRLSDTGVRFVSISMDPVHDTAAAVKAYGKRYGADFSRWTFLTGGQPGETRRIATEGLKFGVGEDPSNPIKLPGGGSMPNITHGTWFVLVGPEGRVLEIYRSSEDKDMDALAQRARRADVALHSGVSVSSAS